MLSIIVLRKKENLNRTKSESAGQIFKNWKLESAKKIGIGAYVLEILMLLGYRATPWLTQTTQAYKRTCHLEYGSGHRQSHTFEVKQFLKI